ncbi:MAG: glycine cleavage system protein GcvH [Planctomycetota bacterium]|jgi:glycine cleavage system H protein
MADPATYRYSDSHEWFSVDGDVVTIGITQYAADELTDITYVELKPAGTTIDAGTPIGEVESVKTTSDVYSVVGGEILEVNQATIDDPSVLNRDPAGDGWLVRLRATDLAPLEELMDRATYDERYPVG